MSETYFPTFKKWYRIPWGSLFTRPFVERKKWQATLSGSELPGVVQDVIRSVIKQTRLNRSEKADVCTELISHFVDGIDAGNSAERMIEDFGEPSLAAKLIRRGKQRSRSMFQKIARAFGLISVFAVVSYAGLWIAFLSGQPKPEVDYVKSLNTSAIELPEDQKAWPIYREAWIENGFILSKFGAEIYRTDEQGVATGELSTPGDKGWPKAVSFLKSHSAMYDAFRAAGAKPVLGLELRKQYADYDLRDLRAMSPGHFDEDGTLINELFDNAEMTPVEKEANELVIGTLLPHIQSFREMARHLQSDLRLAIEEGDSERASQNIIAMLGIARQAAEAKVLVCSLVGLAVADVAMDSIEIAVSDNPGTFSIQQLTELKSQLEKFEVRSLVQFGGERAMFYDILQRLYTDDGNGDGRMTLIGQQLLPYVNGMCGKRDEKGNRLSALSHSAVGLPTSMFFCPSRKEMKDKFDQIIGEAERRFAQPDSEPVDLESFFEDGELEGAYSLINLLIPDVDAIKSGTEQRMERRDATIDLIDAEIANRRSQDVK